MGGRLNLDGGTLNLDGGTQTLYGETRPPYNLTTAHRQPQRRFTSFKKIIVWKKLFLFPTLIQKYN